MVARLKQAALAVILLAGWLTGPAVMGVAEAPPDAVVAARTPDWIVAISVAGFCGETSGGIGLLCGAVLDNAIILTAGHGFWCGEDASSGVIPDPAIEANGTTIRLNSLPPTGLEVYTNCDPACLGMGVYAGCELDLACIDVTGMPMFATGLPVIAELPQSPSLVGSTVWVLGYGRSRLPQAIAGQVTAGGRWAGDDLEIRIDVPITPGLSGSPVLNAAGEVVAVVVAKSLIGPEIYATCVTKPFVECLIVRRP